MNLFPCDGSVFGNVKLTQEDFAFGKLGDIDYPWGADDLDDGVDDDVAGVDGVVDGKFFEGENMAFLGVLLVTQTGESFFDIEFGGERTNQEVDFILVGDGDGRQALPMTLKTSSVSEMRRIFSELWSMIAMS